MTSLCRTCANVHNLSDSINLFQKFSSCKRLLMQVNKVTGLNLKKCDSMPDYICTDCQQCIEQINKFRRTCKEAQFTLEQLNKSKVNTLITVDDSSLELSNYIDDQEDYVGFVPKRDQDDHEDSDLSGQQQKYSPVTYLRRNFTEPQPDLRTENLPLEIVLIEKEFQQEIYNDCEDDDMPKISLENNNLNFEVIQLETNIPYKAYDSDFSISESDPEIDEQSMAPHCHIYIKPKQKRISSKKTESKIAQVNRDEPKRRPTRYICEICGKDFGILQLFNAHVNRHKGELPFACNLCPAKFLVQRSLTRHMLKHSGILPYPCRYCERCFLDHNTRLRHERMHTNTRPFKCAYCDKAFTANIILRNHILTHTKERAFSCELCQRSFLLKKHLHTHFKSNFHKQNEQKANKALEKVN